MRYRLTAGGTTVAIDGDQICEPTGTFELSLSFDEGHLRPGLINSHDHLHRNHYPRLGSPPYADAYAWGHDIHERFAGTIERARAVPRRSALLYGALKNLLAGVTTAVHHDPWERDFEQEFPIRVPRLRTLHSLAFDGEAVQAEARAVAEVGASSPLTIHLAEGTNAAAADEVRTLDDLGLLDERLLAVHCVGVDVDGVRRLRAAGSAVVWCPRSNEFLFGCTAPHELLLGCDVLIGSDSRLTADGTLLDEIRTARQYGFTSDERLRAAIGTTAARRMGLPEPRLEPGAPADLALLRRPLFDASPADVALVIVRGRPQIADPALAPLFEAFDTPVRPPPRIHPARLAPLELADAAEACRLETTRAGTRAR